MLDGKLLKYGQLFVRVALIFNGTAHGNVLVSVRPILRHTLREPFNALGQKEKGAVRPLFDHFPAFAAPRIGFFNEKVGGKAKIHQPRLHFITAFFEQRYRLIKVLCFNDHARINAALGVTLMDIAMQAAFAALFTSTPRISHRHRRTLLSFVPRIIGI